MKKGKEERGKKYSGKEEEVAGLVGGVRDRAVCPRLREQLYSCPYLFV